MTATVHGRKKGYPMHKRPNSRDLVLAAVFAAAIAATTAYILHIPLPTGGYVHVGDALIYLAACLLPMPWAMAAGAVGGMIADLLTAPMWAPATFVIKALICLPFTCRAEKLVCRRNAVAVLVAGLISPALYGLVNVFLARNWAAYWPQFLGTLVQSAGSAVVFAVVALACDKAGLKKRLGHTV